MPEHQQMQKSKDSGTIFQKQVIHSNPARISNPLSIIQRAKMNPKSLTHTDVMQLQRSIGNQAVGRLLSGIRNTSTVQKAPVQKQKGQEEALQGKRIETVQRQETPEEEEPLQRKIVKTVQFQGIQEEEETLQGKTIENIQQQEIPKEEPLQTKKENNTGMPDNLKTVAENLPGMDTGYVRLQHNSSKEEKMVQMKKVMHDSRTKPSVLDSPSGSASSQVPIQRAVGFEFETGWLCEREPFDYSHDDVEQTPQPLVPFKKKDVISSATFNGFRMEADEAGNDQSEIEFVVRPPIEESFEGLKLLDAIMMEMVDLGGRLKGIGAEKAKFPLSRATGVGLDEFTIITPGDEELKAGPQATTGLDLSAIPEFVKYELVRPPINLPKYHGLLVLMKEYLERGTCEGGALSYPKIIAEPLLARTDFVQLLKLAEPNVLSFYKANRDEWVPDVLNAIGLPDIAEKDLLARGVVENEEDLCKHAILHFNITEKAESIRKVEEQIGEINLRLAWFGDKIADYKESSSFFESMHRKIRNEPTKVDMENQRDQLAFGKLSLVEQREKLRQEKFELDEQKNAIDKYAGFTVREWLNSLLNDIDLLPGIQDAESLGEFGNRTEKVGPDKSIDAGIFEYRGAQTSKIPVEEWPSFAKNFFIHILQIHGHKSD